MKLLVSMTALALVSALPALAQTPAQGANLPGPAYGAAGQATTAANNPYAAEAERAIAEEEATPGGGDERVRRDLEWRAEVAKANAYREGMPINLGQIRAEVKHNNAVN